MNRTQIWCSGGGVQSTAIAALIVKGMVEPPDLAVIIDTERECSTTWEYAERWTIPALQEAGVMLHRVPKSKYALYDLYSKNRIIPVIPAFSSKDGKKSRLRGYCSGNWKRDVIRRWATKEHGVKAALMWIGFSTDEMFRAWRLKESEARTKKWHYRFPLLDAKLDRQGCIALVESLGWPLPPKSRCWMCPNQDQRGWNEVLSGVHRDDVINFENEMQKLEPDVWLTSSRQPISNLVEYDDHGVVNDGCESGYCFT